MVKIIKLCPKIIVWFWINSMQFVSVKLKKSINYFPLFQKHVFIFKIHFRMCFHSQNVFFSIGVFIIKMWFFFKGYFHYQNVVLFQRVFSFSKCEKLREFPKTTIVNKKGNNFLRYGCQQLTRFGIFQIRIMKLLGWAWFLILWSLSKFELILTTFFSKFPRLG